MTAEQALRTVGLLIAATGWALFGLHVHGAFWAILVLLGLTLVVISTRANGDRR